MYADSLDSVHLELTTNCNAACPMCPRNLHGGADHPDIPIAQMSLATIQTIFAGEWSRALTHVQMCGNYGDPLMVRDLLDIIRHIRSRNPAISFCINTNGSLRTPSWWRELGTLLTEPVDRVAFGIDGLADTNHLYRRGTDFAKIMANATAFMAAGGKAEWQFLRFKHNEHQVEDAQRLADSLGFKRFIAKRTDRFQTATEWRVLDRNGAYAYSLYPTTVGTSMRREAATGPIRCQMAQKRSIYISAEGLVLPCCWMALIYGENRYGAIRRLIEQTGGKDAINATLHPVPAIIDGAFFRAIMASWPEKTLAVCASMCSETPKLFTEWQTKYHHE